MTRSRPRSVSAALLLVASPALTAVAQTPAPHAPPYPATRRVERVDVLHGVRVADPYRWLEDLNAPATAEWVQAQNAVTTAYLAQIPLRDSLRRRITELWNYPKVSPPAYRGHRWWYSRNSGLQRQAVIYSRATLDASESMVLDPNGFSPDGSIALSGYVPSPDGRYLAYGRSEGGSDWSTYLVRDLVTGRETADTIRWVKFSGLSWTHDGRGFFYGRYPEPEAGRQLQNALVDKKLYYHALGTPQSADRLIYARPEEPTLFLGGALDETGRYLFITTNRGTSNRNELLVADLGDPLHPDVAAAVRPLYMGHTAAFEPLGVVRGRLLLQTDRGAPNRKIVSAALADPAPTHWRTVVPESSEPIASATLIAGRVAVTALHHVASVVRLYSLAGRPLGEISGPMLGTIGGPYGRFDRPEIFYVFTSPLSPATVLRYEAATRRSVAFEPPRLTFDPAAYETRRVFAPSRDGTRVPLFITMRRGTPRDGRNPTMLYGYGGFDISTTPGFRPDVLAWLERGGVWVTASMRGGGEYGERWHEAGMKERKQNVFDDFIGAAEYLVRERYTSPAHLGIMGGSNGGLLVGAVMEQRPDLFAVALPAVGVMDMLRYHRFTGGRAWATEYGSAEDSSAVPYLLKYSPLHNVREGICYPATLVTTADHDDRVVPSHSFKFTATMQEAQRRAPGCHRPVLIRVETQASHGYRPTDKRIAELADQWAFAWAAIAGDGSR